jgi:hypothetical protein
MNEDVTFTFKQISVVPSVGDPDLNVTYGGRRYSERLVGRDEVILCPPLAYDVVEISVYSYEAFCSYDLKVTEHSNPIAPLFYFVYSSYIFDPSQNFISGFLYEIGDGVGRPISFDFPQPTFHYVIFDVRSQNLSCGFHAESRGNTQLTLILNGTEYDVNPFSYSGRSYFDVSICEYSSSSFSNLSLSFRVNTSDISFDIFVTTANLTELIPLHSLYYRDVVDILHSQIYISLPETLPCGIRNVWSSVSSSPFNPLQDFLFPSNLAFSEIEWNLPKKSDGDANGIYTYLLLEDDFSGSAEDVMNTFRFSVGPGIVDSHGRQLVSLDVIHSVVKTNITCDSEVIGSLLNELDRVHDLLVGLDETEVSGAFSAFVASDIIQSNSTWIACGYQIEYMNGSNIVENVTMCGNEICTDLSFQSYSLDKKQIERGVCKLSVKNVIPPNIDAAWYKGCKESVYSVAADKMGRPCSTDDDCWYPWGGGSNLTYVALNETCEFSSVNIDSPHCDTFLGICGDTHKGAEELFWWCFVSNMSLDVQLSLSLRSIDVCNISDIKATFSSNECVSVSGTGMGGLQYRSRYRYVAPLTSQIRNGFGLPDNPTQDNCGCFHSIENAYDLCLDQLCNKPPPCEYTSYDRTPTYLLLPYETSTKSDVCMYSLVHQDNDTLACLREYRCNWNPSLSGDSSGTMECGGLPNMSESFCGVHFNPNDVFYHEIVNVSEEECFVNGGKMCVSPSGSIVFGEKTDQECMDVGYCNVDCPNVSNEWSCLPLDHKKPSICYNNDDALNEAVCNQLSGDWVLESISAESLCIFPLQNNRNECRRNGNVFVECINLSIAECSSNIHLPCYLSKKSSVCGSKSECEQYGVGWCSDNEYFVNYMTSPPTNGSCVVPFLIDTTNNGRRQYCYENTIPLSLG